jgi:hypothetical protein
MPEYVRLYCRGPFSLYTNPKGVSVMLRKSTAASDDEGKDLDPGTCAFGDRPVGPDEPKAILVPTDGPAWQLSHLLDALSRSDHAVVLEVTNTGEFFELDEPLLVHVVAIA